MGNPGNQKKEYRDEKPPDDDRRPPFDPRTYLYIRTHPNDDGTEPLASGLPCWMSPDILITPAGGLPGDVALSGVNNPISVTVTNRGGIDAVDAYIDVFIGNPSTAITPANATQIGSGFLTIPGYNTATISFDWYPGPSDGGHRCLLARVSLPTTGDTYANPAVFDSAGDRHVAQRNIHVVEMAGAKEMGYGFLISNPLGMLATFDIRLEELKPERELIASMRQTLRCGFAQFDDQPLPAIRLQLGDRISAPKDGALQSEAPQRETGVLRIVDNHAAPAQRQTTNLVELGPGETRYASIRLQANSKGRPGDLHVVQVAQRDVKTKALVGGLTIVVQN